MIPSFPTRPGTDGISRVVEAYQKYLPEYGVEFVREGEDYDLKAVHAGVEVGGVCHLHGVYWTADYEAAEWEWESNRQIVNALRQAKQVTVPSPWVAETLQRDLRLNPTIVPHGNWDAASRRRLGRRGRGRGRFRRPDCGRSRPRAAYRQSSAT